MQRFFLLQILFIALGCKGDTRNTSGTAMQSSTNQVQDSVLAESMNRGSLLYVDFCVQCHREDGKGVEGTFPPLAGSNWLVEKRTESIHAVKFGQTGSIIVSGVTYNGVMAPMGLEDDEVADVMNFIMNSWGNEQREMVTSEEVRAVKK